MDTVLIVDDDSDIRAALEEMLELEGFLPQSALDGADALALIRRGFVPGAIVLDLMMPVMGGEELFRMLPPALRERCVVMTAGEPRPLDGVPVLRKPFEMDALIRALRAVCAARPTGDRTQR